MHQSIRKIVLLSILLLSLCSGSQAQKDSTLDQRIGVVFCKEFSKIDSTRLTGGGWEMELGLLILPLIERFKDEIQKEWGISPDDVDGLEKIGEK